MLYGFGSNASLGFDQDSGSGCGLNGKLLCIFFHVAIGNGCSGHKRRNEGGCNFQRVVFFNFLLLCLRDFKRLLLFFLFQGPDVVFHDRCMQ